MSVVKFLTEKASEFEESEIILNFLKEIDSDLSAFLKKNSGDEFITSVTKAVKNSVEEAMGKAEKVKGSRKKKNPDAPKQPSNGYILFCQDNRQIVKEENPELSPKEITSELGRIWREEHKANNSEIYQKYQSMYESNKADFNEKNGMSKSTEVKPKKSAPKKKVIAESESSEEESESSESEDEEVLVPKKKGKKAGKA